MTKSYLKKNTNNTIEVQGQKITIKNLSFGDSRKALNLSTKMDYAKKSAEIDSGLMAALRALYSIVDWDLTDENDEKLPITLDTLDNVLDEDFVGELMQAVQQATMSGNGVTEQEKKK